MEARKFISKEEKIEKGITYLYNKIELKDINLQEDDWDFIYSELMFDDQDRASDNGMYFDKGGCYNSLNCNDALEHMIEFEKEYYENNDEKFEEHNDEYLKTFDKIKKTLEQSEDFTIYFKQEEKNN